LASAADVELILAAVFEAGAAATFTSVTAPFVLVFFWDSEAVSPDVAFFAFSASRSR
jgi:hypothetical protein